MLHISLLVSLFKKHNLKITIRLLKLAVRKQIILFCMRTGKINVRTALLGIGTARLYLRTANIYACTDRIYVRTGSISVV